MDRVLSRVESQSLIARMQASHPSPVMLAMLKAMPAMQQAALLTMHESVVRRAVVRDLLEESQDMPQGPDYRALARRGLCEHKLGKRGHELTDEGRSAAVMLERALCQRFDIHVLTDAGQIGWHQKYSCPCGQWSTLVRKSPTAHGNAMRSFTRHQQTAVGLSDMVRAMKPVRLVEG